MAELHRVEINEKTEGEIEPEDKEEVTEDAPGAEVAATEPVEDHSEGDVERPQWLPEKFKSAEDMANAYSELEKKMGNTEEAEAESEALPSEASNEVVTEASKEYFEKGELTEDTYDSLAKIGLSKELVDSFAAGQAALQDNQSNAIKSAADGNYDTMTEWAGTNLDDDEMNAFNEAVSKGTVEQAKFAVKGLYARWKGEVMGTAPQLLKGETSGTGSMPFQSMQEVSRAMSDPKYKSGDKAYHQMVERRLAVSNV